jgi:SAM-dependent methyltransferase
MRGNPAQLGAITERTLPTGKNVYEFQRIYALVSERFGGVAKSCLDYGCGSGYGSHALSRWFGRVAGIDISEEAIRECARLFSAPNLEFSVFDPSTQPFPDASFDCVFSFQVLEHVPIDQVPDYIRYIWRMLKPGGVGVVTTPNQANYVGGHSGNPYHANEYSAAGLTSLFQGALPDADIAIAAQEDVLSTRTGIRIRRALGNRRPAFWLARIVVGPLRVLERSSLISTDHRVMLRTDRIDSVVGGFYVEIRKPSLQPW